MVSIFSLLLRIHLQSDIEVGIDICFRPVNDRLYIHIFALIAFFVLVIASINFMNLSTARSATRAREIGLRKAVGSNKAPAGAAVPHRIC
jgi:putative ABC transport system permease protein